MMEDILIYASNEQLEILNIFFLTQNFMKIFCNLKVLKMNFLILIRKILIKHFDNR